MNTPTPKTRREQAEEAAKKYAYDGDLDWNDMTLSELKKLAQSANSNVSKEPCVECGFNHLSYRHRNSCSEPEMVFKNTFNPSTALKLIGLLERAKRIDEMDGSEKAQWLKDLEEL